MNNPPLSQSEILNLCGKAGGFSLLASHAHFSNYSEKLYKLANKNLVRMSKRLGNNGAVYVAV